MSSSKEAFENALYHSRHEPIKYAAYHTGRDFPAPCVIVTACSAAEAEQKLIKAYAKEYDVPYDDDSEYTLDDFGLYMDDPLEEII